MLQSHEILGDTRLASIRLDNGAILHHREHVLSHRKVGLAQGVRKLEFQYEPTRLSIMLREQTELLRSKADKLAKSSRGKAL